MFLHVDFLSKLAACLVVAALMMLAGLDKHALQQKHTRRICPSCGRDLVDCSCR